MITRIIPIHYRLYSVAVAVVFALALAGCGSYGVGGTDEAEPNDNMSLADRITGLEINGVIGFAGDEDWYILNAQQGTHPTFIIYHDPDVDFDFEVYNMSYGVMTRVGSALGVSSGDAVTVNTPGQMHIHVWSHRGVGPYRIQINP